MEDYSLVIPNGDEDYDAAIEMLSETNWNELLKTIGHTKEKMYSFFGLQTQKAQKAAAGGENGDTEMIQT
jgi:hypothetical protein